MNPPLLMGRHILLEEKSYCLGLFSFLSQLTLIPSFYAVRSEWYGCGVMEVPGPALRRCGVQALFCSRAWAGHTPLWSQPAASLRSGLRFKPSSVSHMMSDCTS